MKDFHVVLHLIKVIDLVLFSNVKLSNDEHIHLLTVKILNSKTFLSIYFYDFLYRIIFHFPL